MLKVNSPVLNNLYIMRKTKRKFKKILNWKKIKDSIYKNLWDTDKAVKRGKFIALNEYITNEEKSQINKLISHFKNLGIAEQNKPKASKR